MVSSNGPHNITIMGLSALEAENSKICLFKAIPLHGLGLYLFA